MKNSKIKIYDAIKRKQRICDYIVKKLDDLQERAYHTSIDKESEEAFLEAYIFAETFFFEAKCILDLYVQLLVKKIDKLAFNYDTIYRLQPRDSFIEELIADLSDTTDELSLKRFIKYRNIITHQDQLYMLDGRMYTSTKTRKRILKKFLLPDNPFAFDKLKFWEKNKNRKKLKCLPVRILEIFAVENGYVAQLVPRLHPDFDDFSREIELIPYIKKLNFKVKQMGENAKRSAGKYALLKAQ
ncbi:Uncharacterised protein [uncultured archaeon]|nr:Uncharacterised protein [uncultured archaeon]